MRRAFLWGLDGLVGWLLKVRLIQQSFQKICLLLAWSWGRCVFRLHIFGWQLSRNWVEVIGRENWPHTNRVLVVSSHETLADSFAIGSIMVSFWELLFHPKRVLWNAADAKNYLTRPFFRHVFSLLKCIPIVRNSTKLSEHTRMVRDFCRVLEKGNLLLFFEGTRSKTGEIGSCVDGIPVTICRTQPKVIVPVLLHNFQQIMPIEAGFTWRGVTKGKRAQMVIGPPIDLSEFYGQKLSHELRQQIGEQIRQSVVDLKNQLPQKINPKLK